MPLSRITSPFQSATANVYSPSANTVAIRTASADRVTVDSNGNVGIGTNSPSNRVSIVTASGSDGILSVKSPTTDTAGITIDGGSTANKGALVTFSKDATTKWRIGIDSAIGGGTSNNLNIFGSSADALLFGTNAAERMRIVSSGGVSINTTSSLATLTVNGNICPAEAPSSKWGLDFTPSTSAGAYISLGNNATYDLATGSGLIWIWDDAAEGIAQIYCFYGSTSITNVTGGLFSGTKDAASKINVYYESGTGKYRLQNKFGSTKNIWVSTIRMRAAS